jgi:hypothetical protein
LLPILRQEEAKKVLLNPNICSSISVQQTDTYTCPQGEILKPHGTRKAVELSKAVISSRNEHPLAKIVQ